MRYSLEDFVEHSNAPTWHKLLQHCMAECTRTDRAARRKDARYELVEYNKRLARFCFFLHHGVPADGITEEDIALCDRVRARYVPVP